MSAFGRQHTREDQQGHALWAEPTAQASAKRGLEHLDHSMRASSKPAGRTSKITFGGLIYIGVTIFLAIGAVNSQNNLLFWLFGVSIATLIVSGLFSGSALMRVRLEAQAIPDAAAGEALRVHYLVSNHSKFFPLFAGLIAELPGDEHPDARFDPAAILHLGPGQEIKAAGSFVPRTRGRYSLEQIRLSTRFPFGLLEKSLVFQCHRSALVLPYQLEIKPELVRIVQGHGEEVRKHTVSSGSSTEYWGLREYSPGDPKRSIAWKQSARHGQLVVIEHAVSISTKLWIWIAAECFESCDDDPSAPERAIALGASLVTQASRRGIPVGLWVPSRGIRMSPSTGKAGMMRSLRALGALDLSLEGQRESLPGASSTDDVIVLRPGQSSSAAPGAARVLDIDDPSCWLIDPSTLPPALCSVGMGVSGEGDV